MPYTQCHGAVHSLNKNHHLIWIRPKWIGINEVNRPKIFGFSVTLKIGSSATHHHHPMMTTSNQKNELYCGAVRVWHRINSQESKRDHLETLFAPEERECRSMMRSHMWVRCQWFNSPIHIPVVVVVVVIVVVVVHVHAQHLSSAMIIHKNNKMLTRWLLENGERQTKKDGFLSSSFPPSEMHLCGDREIDKRQGNDNNNSSNLCFVYSMSY